MVRSWKRLPATVPHHFNLMGHPDSFGTKQILWVLPMLATVTHAALTAFGLWDFSRRGESIEKTRLNVETPAGATAYGAWMFFFVTRGTINVGLGRRKDLGGWFVPAVLGVLVLLILAASLRLR